MTAEPDAGPGQHDERTRVCGRVSARLAQKLGLDLRLTFHGLRHTADSLMVATGEHAVTMAARLGHSPKLSVGLYGHAPEDVDRAAAERIGQLFAAPHDEAGEPDEEPDGQLRFGLDG